MCKIIPLSPRFENNAEIGEINAENRAKFVKIKRQTYHFPVLFTRKELVAASKQKPCCEFAVNNILKQVFL